MKHPQSIIKHQHGHVTTESPVLSRNVSVSTDSLDLTQLPIS